MKRMTKMFAVAVLAITALAGVAAPMARADHRNVVTYNNGRNVNQTDGYNIARSLAGAAKAASPACAAQYLGGRFGTVAARPWIGVVTWLLGATKPCDVAKQLALAAVWQEYYAYFYGTTYFGMRVTKIDRHYSNDVCQYQIWNGRSGRAEKYFTFTTLLNNGTCLR
jgi:hypothetical protein